ncbi:glycosyltransferase [Enterococcus casseliflavus]
MGKMYFRKNIKTSYSSLGSRISEMKKTIGILILNYLAFQDTIECVESLMNQTFKKIDILIVDNDSPNDSFKRLSDNFEDSEQVTVVKMKENLGFARGNNFGLSLFRKKGIERVLVINGDTLLEDRTYLEKLASISYNKDIGMIGTKIITRDGKNQNTLNVNLKKKADLVFHRMILLLLESSLRLNIYPHLKKLMTLRDNAYQSVSFSVETQEILDPYEKTLHGAAIFFTENYLRYYIGFYPETFLYNEEDYLAILCQRLGYKQLYIPSLSIYHKEDASSDLLYNDNLKKSYLFKLKNVKKNLSLMSGFFSLSNEDLKRRMSI